MIFEKLRDFNAGFTRFFFAIDNWLIVHWLSYREMKNEWSRPFLIESFRERFFLSLNPND